MKRILCVLLAASSFAGAALSLQRPASAKARFYEIQPKVYCAASIGALRPVSKFPGLWRYDLSGVGAFHADVELTVVTAEGLYAVFAPDVHIVRNDGRYQTAYAKFMRHEDASAAQFFLLPPDAGAVKYAWVHGIGKPGATVLDRCPPMIGVSDLQPLKGKPASSPHPHGFVFRQSGITRVNASVYDPHARPTSASSIVPATQISTPHEDRCRKAFQNARTLRVVQPVYPRIAHSLVGAIDVPILVQIGLKNDVTGALLLAPTGVKGFDDAALLAAENSVYRSARAFCRPAYGDYIFYVTFTGTGA
uniref:TonB C-terminal domain-containing protein n=1 Tax=mine drainage metagenome TaxID=410659 RepID=E6Q1G4_9ZZZZ